MLITDAQARAHLRIDEGENISIYIGGAERAAIEFLNRNVYKDQAELDAAVDAETAGDHPMVADDLIRSAILLIVGHLYANREDAVVGASVAELPMGSLYLLQPHRRHMGV